jgi:uncharacterized membrane protein YbhN (UPF0104 family)
MFVCYDLKLLASFCSSMSVNDLTERKAISIETPADESKNKIKNLMVWAQAAIFLAALSLLVYVIYNIGLQTIADALRSIGWGFLAIIGLNGSRHFLRAFSLYLAIPPQHHHSFKYHHAVSVRLGGEAVNVLTFTGPLLGEATKAALLKKRLPLSHGVAAVVVDNILYDISVILIILGGVLAMFYAYGSNDQGMNYALLSIAVIAVLAIIGILTAAKFRITPMSWTIKKLAKFKWMPQFIINKRERIRDLEASVYDFHEQRRKTFYAMLGINFLAHVLSVFEVYIALRLLGYAASLNTSYIIESLTKIINFAFSFVPGTIGVYEGGNGIILRTLGYTTAIGVTLALVRRGAILFWTFIGLLILIWRTIPRKKPAQPA